MIEKPTCNLLLAEMSDFISENVRRALDFVQHLVDSFLGYKLSLASSSKNEHSCETLLRQWRLGRYIDTFAKNDWDEVATWKHLTDEILANDLGLNNGAVRKFRFNYTKWCVRRVRRRSNEGSISTPGTQKSNGLKLCGNWSDNRSTYRSPATYTLDPNSGLVTLTGIITLKHGYHDELVARLPKEIHPSHFIYENRVDSSGETVNIGIYAKGSSYGKCGEIKLRGSPNSKGVYLGSASYISINGISWYVSDVKKEQVRTSSDGFINDCSWDRDL